MFYSSGSQPGMKSSPGENEGDSVGEVNETFSTSQTIIATETILRRISAEKTGSERVHACGAGRHVFKEGGLCLI